MDEKYYIVTGGAQQQKIDGQTKEEIISQENTAQALITLKRLKEKVIEYLKEKEIPFTKVVISPSIDLYLSGKNMDEYENIMKPENYGEAFRMDFIYDYCSIDLTCIAYMFGDEEELIYPHEHDNFGLNLNPIVIRYNLFRDLLGKTDIVNTAMPPSFGEYKKAFIDAETSEYLGYILDTDITIYSNKLTLM